MKNKSLPLKKLRYSDSKNTFWIFAPQNLKNGSTQVN
jgi:hypothetical protein